MASRSSERHTSDLLGPLAGGLVASFGLFGGIVLVGRLGSGEALQSIRAVVPTAQFTSGAVVGAGATVLALMLTLLALTNSSEWEFTDTHFVRVRWITRLATWSILMAIGILIALAVPIEEVEELRTRFVAMYYGLAVALSIMGGLVVSMVFMIGATVHGLIDLGHTGRADYIARAPTDEPDTEDTS